MSHSSTTGRDDDFFLPKEETADRASHRRPADSTEPSDESAADLDTPQEVAHFAGPRPDELNPMVQETLAELDRLYLQKRSLLKGLLILAASLALFVMTGVLDFEATDLALLIVVLLIHESGHYLGMRVFGYQNVQMFFIPFFGAAVSGRTSNVPAWQQAVVFLLGPVPGLIIGAGLCVPGLLLEHELLLDAARMFLIINGFNLLPIFPLDGGQLLNLLLFCRNRYTEAVFRAGAGALMAAAGWFSSSWLLGAFGVMILLSSSYSFKISSMAQRLRLQFDTQTLQTTTTADIPRDFALPIIQEVRARFPEITRPRTIAQSVHNVWEKLRLLPPGGAATAFLLLTYAGSFCIAPIVLVVMALATPPAQFPGADDDQSARFLEEIRHDGRPASRTEVSDELLYHGTHAEYHPETGKIAVRGAWNQGRRHGRWTFYDASGQAQHEIIYNNGRFVSYERPGDPDSLTRNPDEVQLPPELQDALDPAPAGPTENWSGTP